MSSKTKAKKQRVRCAVFIAAATPRTVKRLERAVMKVLNCKRASNSVKENALQVLADTLATRNTISNSTFHQ